MFYNRFLVNSVMNTEVLTAEGRAYCAYCGKKIEADTKYHCFRCDCEDAINEIRLREEKSALVREFQEKIKNIENQMPKAKYIVTKKEVLIEK